jgi:hypothetical protein
MYRLSSTHVSVASLARERPNLNSSWLTEFARYGSNLRIVIGQSKYQIDKGIDTTSFTCKSDFDRFEQELHYNVYTSGLALYKMWSRLQKIYMSVLTTHHHPRLYTNAWTPVIARPKINA